MAALLLSLPLSAAQPYHLELEATPAAAFPWLGKFGSVELHVYAGGVRAEALLMNAFSKNGAPAVTVENPLSRTYSLMQVKDIAATIRSMSGGQSMSGIPTLGPSVRGKVSGLDATRHRLVYGPTAYIDVWTTTAVPKNPQLARIVDQLVTGIAPGSAALARSLPGTPVYIELNFRRFKKVALLKVTKMTMAADDEEEALKLGALYF